VPFPLIPLNLSTSITTFLQILFTMAPPKHARTPSDAPEPGSGDWNGPTPSRPYQSDFTHTRSLRTRDLAYQFAARPTALVPVRSVAPPTAGTVAPVSPILGGDLDDGDDDNSLQNPDQEDELTEYFEKVSFSFLILSVVSVFLS
jgi:hypothetical protein